jgi:hypothetical protein
MPIIAVESVQPTGLQSVVPSVIYILTNDTYATVTATGYLTQSQSQGNTYSDSQMALVFTSDEGPVWLKVVITFSGATVLNTVVSLVSPSNSSGVTLPTTANHIATYTNTEGNLSEDPTIALTGGSIQALGGTVYAGNSATPTGGVFYAYSPNGLGDFQFKAANTGAFNVILSNATHAQSSTYLIPDCGNAAGEILVGATATPFVSGNFPVASGAAGLMVDSGVAATNLMKVNAVNTMTGSGQIILVKANGTEASNAVTASGNAGVITTSSLTTAGGATYAITWTNTKITATSVLSFAIQGGTNTTQNITFTCVPGSGTATLTIYNNTAATALNGTILIGYMVM